MANEEEATPQGANDAADACPYLGLADDADSHATFATDAHRCFRLANPTRIASGHQDTYCLSENHLTCPVYLGQAVSETRPGAAVAPTQGNGDNGENHGGDPPPEEGLGPRPRSGGIPMPALTIGILVLAAIVLGLAIWINGLGGDDGDGPVPSDILQTQTALQTQQAATPKATGSPTGAASTPTSAPGTTATATSAIATAATSGVQTYTVVAGDTCTAIAEAHGITLADLFLANDLDNDSCLLLEIGRDLVIP